MKARQVLEATVFGSILTLGAPMAAGAQGSQQEREAEMQQHEQTSHSQARQTQSSEQAGSEQQVQAGKRDSVRGTVSKVEAEKGELTLRTEEGEEMELHGKPTELQRVREGDEVRARYQEWGSEKWLSARPQKVQGAQQSQQRPSESQQSPSESQQSPSESQQSPSESQQSPSGGYESQ